MEWFKQNTITLLLLLVSIAVSWGVMNARVDALGEKIERYPSQDWFELKFKNIDESIDEVNSRLKNHLEKP